MKLQDYITWKESWKQEVAKREKLLKQARYSLNRFYMHTGEYIDPQSDEAEKICKELEFL